MTNLKCKTKKVALTQSGSINKSVRNMLLNCGMETKTHKIRTGYYSGSGRYCTAHSAIHTVRTLLEAQGYKYTVGNDAPRGGVLGEYVKVSRTAFNFINELRSK